MAKRIAVIGLGRFGTAAAKALAYQGHEVIAIDNNEVQVNRLAQEAELEHLAGIFPVAGDATEEAVLEELEIPNLDAVVIAIGSNLVASILATVLIRQKIDQSRKAGKPSPRLLARARDRIHAAALSRLGVDLVVRPEEEMGEVWAKRLFAPPAEEYLPLSAGLALVLTRVPPHLHGKTLQEAGLYPLRGGRPGVAVMAILPRRGDPVFIPAEDERLRREDRVILVGTEPALRQVLEQGEQEELPPTAEKREQAPPS